MRTERFSTAGTLLMAVGLLGAGLLNTSCRQGVTVPVNFVDGLTILDFGGRLAGEPIPDDFEAAPLPVCGPLPSREDLRGLFDFGLGDLLVSLIHLESVELLETTLTATSGDFDVLTHLGLAWRPSDLAGVPQPRIDLGSETALSGLESPTVLTPDQPVDFLAIIDSEAINPSADCPSLIVEVKGHVPDPIPTWNVQLLLRVTARFGV